MNAKPRLVILNSSCLDVMAEYRDYPPTATPAFGDQATPERYAQARALRAGRPKATRDWLSALPVEVVADESFRNLKESGIDEVLENANALILPAAISRFPWAEHMQRFTRLQMLSIAASGYDWLDVKAATANGILVTFAPVPEGAEVVADMTFGLLLAVTRQIPWHWHLIRQGNHVRGGAGVTVWGKTIGIVGLGNIGRAVARRAKGFAMKILATDPYPPADFAREYGIEMVRLKELLKNSDFVCLHLRLNPDTEGMIGRRELGMMKQTGFLINTARQKLVDETALAEALSRRIIAGAAMDDPPLEKNSPLLQMPNFVCTPHLGNRAWEGMRAVFECAVENAVAVLEGRRPEYIVNPEVLQLPENQKRFRCN